ncbi:MAG TPA: xanthine dehydrogenase family protein molybdopterin-binding subunit [Xanthobacteraceae bacterium]|nr:xanthine dehydrogenase family protein molybdopterin-binding subunit [Xanthobacteraceae bacterium]
MAAQKFIGQPIVRIEDAALLRGAGRFVDDVPVRDALEATFVRSAHAHARIRSIDVAAARAAPGVHAVLTYADIRPLLTQDRMPLELRVEKLPENVTPYPLARDEVVFVGEAIVAVIADSRYAAEDAAALVEIDYEPLPAVADCVAAIAPGAPRVDTRQPSNIIKDFRQSYGNAEAAFAGAPHRAALRLKTHRGCAHPIEARAVLARHDELEDRLTVWASTQETHDLRGHLMAMFGRDENQVRVITADVGGGFGCKHLFYPEEAVVAAAALMLRRPVKWVEDRRENFAATVQERDQVWDIEVAFDDDGRLRGIRGRMVHDQGAYTPRGTNLPTNASTAVPGTYVLPSLDLRVLVAATNKVATLPIRGAGYPEGTFAIERCLDAIAHELKLDLAEVRRRNIVPPDRMPYATGLTARSGSSITYDSGDFPEMMEMVLGAIDHAGFAARQQVARAKGHYLGLGMAMGIKGTGRGPFESARVRIDRAGKVTVFTGAVAIGQGLKTAFAQICAEELGVPPRDITVVAGDTGGISLGMGAFASRQTVMGGSAVHVAASVVRDKVRKAAAEILEVDEGDLELRDGRVEVKGVPTHGLGFGELAIAMAGVPGYKLPGNLPPGLEHAHNHLGNSLTYAGAFMAVELEVDPETGRVELHKIVVVNDAGRAINPTLVRGQVLGSVVHTLGNTLFERMVYDDDAQPQTTTFADYLLPTSPELPNIDVILVEYPSKTNPLGVKGAGETACIPVPAAIVSAVENALAPFGVRLNEFPLSPAGLFQMIQDGRASDRQ